MGCLGEFFLALFLDDDAGSSVVDSEFFGDIDDRFALMEYCVDELGSPLHADPCTLEDTL